jgi:hypothetical protein
MMSQTPIVILSEVVVREADDNAVEGPRVPRTRQRRFREFPSAERTPFRDYASARKHGLLRLRKCFAFAKHFLRSG